MMNFQSGWQRCKIETPEIESSGVDKTKRKASGYILSNSPISLTTGGVIPYFLVICTNYFMDILRVVLHT